MIHPQARYMTEKLFAAGFTRSEFSVRTIRYTTKADRAMYGDYGHAIFIPRCPVERQIALIPQMRMQGLDVVAYTWAGKISMICVYDKNRIYGSYVENPLE